ISNAQLQIPNITLIITVDNGIVAFDAVNFANKQGIDVIITDHHVPDTSSKKKPNAYEIIHTTKLCGAGVAYLLMQEFKIQNSKFKINQKEEDHLELVALATIADLVPLKDANRTLVYHGLAKLHETKRIGLLELFKEADLEQKDIDVYAIGHVIAPRLNAAGRLEYAMDSLRLLCTSNRERARKLAEQLGRVNKERQLLTLSSVAHARLNVQERTKRKKLLFLFDESYQQGIIGLIAGRLVEEFYRPSIVVSKGEIYSKASARSVRGFNIIEFIRSSSEFLVDAGGHPMAAGFTVETKNLEKLQISLEDKAEELLHKDLLVRSLHIDMQLPLEIISQELFDATQTLSPFGMNNPEPTFMSKNVQIIDMRFVGKEKKHLKFKFSPNDEADQIDAIAFGFGDRSSEFKIGDTVDIVYIIDENHWNGNTLLQLKIKDIKKT
ncbi:MAG: DHHA1 domain-containing protein, partial [Patescibacteria group bacterium]